MAPARTLSNRLRSYTGTIHYAENGRPACIVRTSSSWLIPTLATVNCQRCIAMFGADEQGHEHVDAPVDENIARRAAERAARQAERLS